MLCGQENERVGGGSLLYLVQSCIKEESGSDEFIEDGGVHCVCLCIVRAIPGAAAVQQELWCKFCERCCNAVAARSLGNGTYHRRKRGHDHDHAEKRGGC